jgi:hypothetical protein
MSQPQTLPLLSFFTDLTDPRVENTRRHKLLDIIGLTVCAVIAGADDWVHVEYFGKAKIDWLKTFLDLPNGIPRTTPSVASSPPSTPRSSPEASPAGSPASAKS